LTRIYNSANYNRNPLNFETRKVESNGRSLVTVLPKMFTDELGILRGDIIKFQYYTADKRKIVIEKVNLNEVEEA
jgi:bifunctional DNA-binding transcriptional regulator/antitoxin component of YhaV-PrlF toxin-antitoxin module